MIRSYLNANKNIIIGAFKRLSLQKQNDILLFAQKYTVLPIKNIEDVINNLNRPELIKTVAILEKCLYPYQKKGTLTSLI